MLVAHKICLQKAVSLGSILLQAIPSYAQPAGHSFIYMDLSVTTPALLFPAISLLMLAHTNRFLALASLIRSLNDRYRQEPGKQHLLIQIKNLRGRLKMIRTMQLFGILSFLLCALDMGFIMWEWKTTANIVFAASLGSFIVSLMVSFMEILLSMKALEVELQDMEAISR